MSAHFLWLMWPNISILYKFEVDRNIASGGSRFRIKSRFLLRIGGQFDTSWHYILYWLHLVLKIEIKGQDFECSLQWWFSTRITKNLRDRRSLHDLHRKSRFWRKSKNNSEQPQMFPQSSYRSTSPLEPMHPKILFYLRRVSH